MKEEIELTSDVFKITDRIKVLKRQIEVTTDYIERARLEAKVSVLTTQIEARSAGGHARHAEDDFYRERVQRLAQRLRREGQIPTSELTIKVLSWLKGKGTYYVYDTIRDWILDVTPPHLKSRGRPKKEK